MKCDKPHMVSGDSEEAHLLIAIMCVLAVVDNAAVNRAAQIHFCILAFRSFGCTSAAGLLIVWWLSG